MRGEGEPGAFWKRPGEGRQTVGRVVQEGPGLQNKHVSLGLGRGAGTLRDPDLVAAENWLGRWTRKL